MTKERQRELLERVRKLYALANDKRGASEAEAALALERAQALLLRYNLDASMIQDPELREKADGVSFESPGGHRLAAWATSLLDAIGRFNYCRVILTGNNGTRFTIVGRPADVQVAHESFLFIMEQVRRLIRQHRPAGVEGMSLQHARRAFAIGCAARVRERLHLAKLERERGGVKPEAGEAGKSYTGAEVTALVIVKQKEVDDKVKVIFPRLRSARSRAQSHQKFAGSFTEGHRAGDKVRLGTERKITNPNTKLLG